MADRETLVERLRSYPKDHNGYFAFHAYHKIGEEAASELDRLNAKVDELERNHAEYERIVGPKTYQEVADEIADLSARLARAVEEVERLKAKDDKFTYWNRLPETEKARIRQNFHDDMHGGADD